MRCKHTKQGANDYYDEHIERYYEEKRDAWMRLVAGEAESYYEQCESSETDPNMADFSEGLEEDFEFPEEGDWLASEYEGMLGDCADQAYEEEKDRRMFKDDE